MSVSVSNSLVKDQWLSSGLRYGDNDFLAREWSEPKTVLVCVNGNIVATTVLLMQLNYHIQFMGRVSLGLIWRLGEKGS